MRTYAPLLASSHTDMDVRLPKRFVGPCSVTEIRCLEFLRPDEPNVYRLLNDCSIYFRTTTLLMKYAV